MTGSNVLVGDERFLAATYDETLELLERARDYCAAPERARERLLDPCERALVQRETMRVTVRLTNVMAWLLIRRAYAAGEIGPGELATAENRLGGRDICLVCDEGILPALPRGLRELLDASYRLYVRILRLDGDRLGVAAGA